MAKKSRTVWVSPETLKLCKLASIKDGSINNALNNAIVKFIEDEGEVYEFKYDRGKSTKSIIVSEEVWYLVDRFRIELGMSDADEFVFTVISNYLLSLGLSENCLLQVLELL